MNKPVITIDIDGVIFDTPLWTTDSFNARTGKKHDISELFDHNASHNKAILLSDTDHYHDTQKQKELYVLNDGCEAALKELSRDYTLVALTSRNYDEFHEVTDELIKLHAGSYIDQVVYTTQLNDSNHKEKGEIAKELGAVIHIDDSIKFCLSCERVGVPAILFTQPYNQAFAYDSGRRAHGWSEIPAMVAKFVHSGSQHKR